MPMSHITTAQASGTGKCRDAESYAYASSLQQQSYRNTAQWASLDAVKRLWGLFEMVSCSSS